MKRTRFDTAFGSYKVVEQVGQGGSGIVYEVADEEGKPLAVKCLRPEIKDKSKIKRFKNELFFCLRNPHKNIITVLDFGLAQDGARFYVMPYYRSTLRRLMQAGIPGDQVLPLFSQILDGLEAAHHRSVWHRDLKPENVLHDPDTNSLVVADFGIAHFTEEQLRTDVETKPRDRLASFQYAAPEQCPPTHLVDHRADIYALGLILNEMFTGQVLRGVDSPSIEQSAPEYAYLDALVQHMAQHLPENRPDSIDTIKQQLIGRGLEFVERQKLSKLQRTVVPHSEIDDPLVLSPPKLTADVDYQGETLYLGLSHRVHPEWIEAFHGFHLRSAPYNMTRGKYSFEGDQVSIRVPEAEAQEAVDILKDYLERANEEYQKRVLRRKRQEQEEQRKQLEDEIREEEARYRVIKNLKI
jgi:serine/threonine protein kinase